MNRAEVIATAKNGLAYAGEKVKSIDITEELVVKSAVISAVAFVGLAFSKVFKKLAWATAVLAGIFAVLGTAYLIFKHIKDEY